MARLDLSLFGGFAVCLDGRPVTHFKSDKTRALLAYLAVEAGRPHRREALAALLWPDRPEAVARDNLSQALYNLRVTLGGHSLGRAPRPAGDAPITHDPVPVPLFLAVADTIQINPAAGHHVDATVFAAQARLEHAHEPGAECDACLQRLGEAAALYRGAFLQGFSIPDSAPYEEWATTRREQCHRLALDALHRLAAAHERRGSYALGQQYAWRQVELDPWREEGQRQLMRLLALTGQRSAALAQYEACRKALAEELGAEPAPETTALYRQILDNSLAPTPRPHPPEHPRPFSFASPPPRPAVSPSPFFVAREQELGHLEAWLEEALAGQGRAGFVVGEPGSGKTVLLREFAHRAMAAHPELVVATGTCNAYAGLGDSYLPFVEILRLFTGDIESRRAAGTLSREHAQRLRETTPLTLQAIVQHGSALIDFFLRRDALVERARALPDGARWEAAIHEAISRRANISSQAPLHDQLIQVLQVVAASRPLLLILDDLQWADAPSISLLFQLGRRLGSPGPGMAQPAMDRLLVLGAYRPDEVIVGRDGQPHPLAAVLHELQALWGDTVLDLGQAEGRAFVDALVDREPNRLGPGFRETLYRRTGGHALFSVELWHGLQQRGDLVRDQAGAWVEGPSLDWDRLPVRVEAVIAAHIARLPREEQELLTVASIEGEEFHAEVVARVLHKDDQEVVAALSGSLSQEHRLLRAESLRRLGEQQFSRYRFRHYLFQRYLYQRLDPVRRAHLHGEVAEALEALGAVCLPSMDMQRIMVDDRSDVLGGPEWIASDAAMAWHWEEAGLPEKAAAYHGWLARRVLYLSYDYPKMLAHVAKALDLLAAAPETPKRLFLQERCTYILGLVRSWMVSLSAPEVGRLWRKALDLAEKLGDPLLVADALNWLVRYHWRRGEVDTALALGERAAVLAQGGHPGWVLWVQASLAMPLLDGGDFARAARMLAPLTDPLLRTGSVPEPPWNLDTSTLAPLALWCMGYPDRALEVGRAAHEQVLRTRDRIMISTDVSVIFNALLTPHRLRREVGGVEEGLEILRPIVEEQRCSRYQLPVVAMHRGWVHAQRGLLEQGIAEMRKALCTWSRDHMRMRPYYKGLIAEALARAGRLEEGMLLLDMALKQVQRTGERWSEAELWRLKGELLRPSSPALLPSKAWEKGEEEAEGCFWRAIEVARGQEAKSWELRATMSLARLLRGQGRQAEAREMLAAIYGWFTEGFDTPDLMEARALLDELGA